MTFRLTFITVVFSCSVLLVAMCLACGGRGDNDPSAYYGNTTPVDLVQPLVDAANSRWFFFNSATRPFGMVNLSPDMEVDGDWGTGYRYHQDTIRCFSHIHGWQLSGIPVLPTTGPFRVHLRSEEHTSELQSLMRISYAVFCLKK